IDDDIFVTGVPSDRVVVGGAYTNKFSGADSTTLYLIDSGNDMLYRQETVGQASYGPTSGELFEVGELDHDLAKNSELAIFSYKGGNYGYGLFGGSDPSLYRVDLETGQTSRFSQQPIGNFHAQDMAIQQ